jgi:centrosomal protein CEP19
MEATEDNCIPKKCGIRFSPPALILVYEDKSRKDKLRKHVMPIRSFRTSSSVNFVAQDLKFRHGKILHTVSTVQVEKMLRVLQEHMKGSELLEALQIVNKEFSVGSNEDLNKLGDDALRRKKEIMDQIFNKNRIKPEDPEFVYDKQIDFDQNVNEKVESGWDTENSDDLFWN